MLSTRGPGSVCSVPSNTRPRCPARLQSAMLDNISFILRAVEDVVYEQRPVPEGTFLSPSFSTRLLLTRPII